MCRKCDYLPRPPHTSFTHRKSKQSDNYLFMNNNIGLFWLRDDFRLTKNNGLIEATINHNQVVVFYLYKSDTYKDQEAQKWWLSKSLQNFRKDLNKLNISLEIVEANSFKNFFDKLVKKKDFSIYWNKVYEPDYLKFDEYLSNSLKIKNINHKIFKGNTLNEIGEIKKNDNTPFKVFTPFWRTAEKYYIEKIPSKEKKIKKCKKKLNYFKNCIEPEKILPKKKWFKNFEKIWFPEEQSALKELKKFINERINSYSEERNFPFKVGTSKLSPYVKFGQIHVEIIWNECIKKEQELMEHQNSFEIGWREFNHSLINYFPYMLKNNYSKNLINFHGKIILNF